MAEIIDNVIVGEKIKSLLKEHKMTQDDLAQKLSITKSAVSQNLRGKSSFDIQNLIKIAEIFDITLDALLNINKHNQDEWISEYQKVVKMGLDGIKDVPVENLTIKSPDLYGRVLIDYVIEANNLEMFKYLHSKDIQMTDLFYHRAKEIFLNILKYGLENKLDNMYKYILLYSQVNGSFKIEDETTEKVIWGLIDHANDEALILALTNYKIDYKSWFNFKKTKSVRPLSKKNFMELIAKYKLDTVLKHWLNHGARIEDLTNFVDVCLDYNYEVGILQYVNHFCTKPLSWIKKVALDVQRLYLKVVEINSVKLIKLFVEKKLYIDLSGIVKRMIILNQLTNASTLITHYPDQLNFREIALIALEQEQTEWMKHFLHLLSEDDLSYLLAYLPVTSDKNLLFLLKHGARIDEKYYNLDTFKKVNIIIEKLIDKGDKS